MVPRIDTAEQAREAVSYLRYPPDGARGHRARRPAARGSASSATPTSGAINERILGIIQIESPSAVDARRRDRRASTASTSCSSARPTCRIRWASRASSTTRPTSTRSRAVVAACERAGKAAGILLCDAAALPRHLELGFRFIGLGSDGAFVADGARAVLAEARG